MTTLKVGQPRSHTKSRGGCKTCKTRKVKCDEARPSCGSCTRRNVHCIYATELRPNPSPQEDRLDISPGFSPGFSPSFSSDPSLGPSPGPSETYSSTQSSPNPSAGNFDLTEPGESKERRLLEMKLMHHFVTSTIKTDFLSIHDDATLQMWLNTAPTLAFEHSFLLNIIISVAALHISKIQPERQDMSEVHRTYFSIAINEHRQAVQNITPENVEAVLISTILIAFPAFVYRSNNELGLYVPPLQLFSLLSGNIPIFKLGLTMLPKESQVWCFVTAKPNMRDFMHDAPKEEHWRQFSHFLNWRAPDEIVDESSYVAYQLTLSYIGFILARIESGHDPLEIRRMVYGLGSVAPPVFVERLKENNPRALVILAYYFSLVKAVDGVWWMRGIAEREVFGIQSILPEGWQWALSWPLKKMMTFTTDAIPPMMV